jgi:hypothetical protein
MRCRTSWCWSKILICQINFLIPFSKQKVILNPSVTAFISVQQFPYKDSLRGMDLNIKLMKTLNGVILMQKLLTQNICIFEPEMRETLYC